MSHITKTYEEVLSLGTFDEDKGTFTFDNIVLKDALLDLYTKAFTVAWKSSMRTLTAFKRREPMKLSEAGHTSNIEYWKAVAKRYQSQRDMALQKVQFLQERMLSRRPAKRMTATTGYDRSLPPERVATIPSTIFCAK
jgi:cation transport regulator ChaB